MNKKILVVGVIILIIGGALAAIGYTGMMNESASSLKDDYDDDKNEFKSYDKGDTIKLTGEITNKSDQTRYSHLKDKNVTDYEMDDEENFTLSTDKDMGSEGDLITVTLNVKEEEHPDPDVNETYETFEVDSYTSTMTAPITLAGFGALIVGIIMAIAGSMMGGAEEEFEEETFEDEFEEDYEEDMSSNEPPEEEF